MYRCSGVALTSISGDPAGRSRENMAHIRQSRPDSGLGFQVKFLIFSWLPGKGPYFGFQVKVLIFQANVLVFRGKLLPIRTEAGEGTVVAGCAKLLGRGLEAFLFRVSGFGFSGFGFRLTPPRAPLALLLSLPLSLSLSRSLPPSLCSARGCSDREVFGRPAARSDGAPPRAPAATGHATQPPPPSPHLGVAPRRVRGHARDEWDRGAGRRGAPSCAGLV